MANNLLIELLPPRRSTPTLNADFEWWRADEAEPCPILPEHPCFGTVFMDNAPKNVAHTFMVEWIEAEDCRLALYLDEGVWYDYTQGYPPRPRNRDDPIDDDVLAARCWGRRIRYSPKT